MFLLLDSGVLGRLCHTNEKQYLPVARRLCQFVDAAPDENKVFIPEIADYETRRKLLHLVAKGHRATLVTANVRDFVMIDRLKIEDWTKS